MLATLARPGVLAICASIAVTAQSFNVLPSASFGRGDLVVSLEAGPVQWYLPDGTLRGTLVSTVPGTGEGMGFDPAGNLYVTRWCADPMCASTGNTVEMFNTSGVSMGAVGAGYDCSPHAIVFTSSSTAFVGQAGCTGDVLRFGPGMTQPVGFDVAPEHQGSFWVDMAPDGCTLFYSSVGPNVKRYDTCTRTQLADFNLARLPGGVTHDLRVLADGGVLVSSGEVIARLDASGALVQTYSGPPESTLWAGLDLVGDGTFWAVNYFSATVYKFDLASGAVLAGFSTGPASNLPVAVRVKK